MSSEAPPDTPVPIVFVLEDFESEFRLNTDAETYQRTVERQSATFALDVSVNIADFNELFKFTTDDITLVADTENNQRLEFITDIRNWGALTPNFAYLPASSLERNLTTYTTDASVSAVQAYVSWFTFKLTSIKDSAVLIKNVGAIAADMDARFKNQIWKQELYQKLWKHSMKVTPTKDYTGATISGRNPDILQDMYVSDVSGAIPVYRIKDYATGSVVSTIPASDLWIGYGVATSSEIVQEMYHTKTDVANRIAVVPYIDDSTEGTEVSIAQKIFDQIIQHDPSRIRGIASSNILDKDGAVITDVSGNSFTNIYKFPFFVGDSFEMKVNVLVHTDNVNQIFSRDNVTMSTYLSALNTSFNNASTANAGADEHENYISYLVRINLYEPEVGA